MRVLALDFDGVISDSAPEAFVVALRAYVALRPGSRLREALEELAPALASGQLDRDLIATHPLYDEFVEMMPLGNRAEDFGVELCLLERGIGVRDQRDYDERRAAQPPGFLADFHARFYRERSALAEAEPQAWLSMLGPYPAFVALLRRRSRDAVLAVATAKDRVSVDRLLASYGIADLFEPRFVLDKETGISKRAHLRLLAERSGAPLAEITFVDDKLNHLEDVAGLGVRCALAAWGYNGVRERRRAAELGYLVCSLGDAEELLFG